MFWKITQMRYNAPQPEDVSMVCDTVVCYRWHSIVIGTEAQTMR